jgi:hypothetical protein
MSAISLKMAAISALAISASSLRVVARGRGIGSF